MAWNEPGGSGGNKDPWGNRNNEQGPPDLDEVVRKMQQKIGGIFKKGGGGGGGGSDLSASMLLLVIGVVVLLWVVTGFYRVDAAEQGVVLRFGKFSEKTEPGLRWHIPYPIETVNKVNVSKIHTSLITGASGNSPESLMLTQDENIVYIKLSVQYKVRDPKEFLFNVRDPIRTLEQSTESALREVIGKSKMDYILTEGRGEISNQVSNLTQEIIDRYKTGLIIENVNMQDAQAPEQVRHAFEDAVKAREDEQRFINEAQTYLNAVLPKARGDSARRLEESEGYKAQVIAQSEGEAARFVKVLKEYERAPRVTRQRLYIEAMESVMKNASKIMIDVKQGNNMVFLPLDKILQSADGESRKQIVRSLIKPENMPSRPDMGPEEIRSREPRERRVR